MKKVIGIVVVVLATIASLIALIDFIEHYEYYQKEVYWLIFLQNGSMFAMVFAILSFSGVIKVKELKYAALVAILFQIVNLFLIYYINFMNIVFLIAFIVAGVVIFIPTYRNKIVLWISIITSIVYLASIIEFSSWQFTSFFNEFRLLSLLWVIRNIAYYLIFAMFPWIIYMDNVTQLVDEEEPSVEVYSSSNENEIVNVPVMVVLSIITFGIYYLVWTYQIARTINDKSVNGKNPMVEIILLVLVPFYRLYWIYNKEKDFYQTYPARKQDNSALYLILSIFGLDIVSVILIQNELNMISVGKKSTLSDTKKPTSVLQTDDTYERLSKLKHMYEDGLITESEYTTKKRELLQNI